MAGVAVWPLLGATTFSPGGGRALRPGCPPLPAPASLCPPLGRESPAARAAPTGFPGRREGTDKRATSSLINTMKSESASVWASRKEKRPLNSKPEKQLRPCRASRGKSERGAAGSHAPTPRELGRQVQRVVRKLASKAMRVSSLQNVVRCFEIYFNFFFLGVDRYLSICCN